MWVVALVFACLGFSILYALTDLSGAHEIQRVLEEYFKISADDQPPAMRIGVKW